MRVRIKRLLLALMVIVFPLQAFASAAMVGCAFSQPAQTLQHAVGPTAATMDMSAMMSAGSDMPCHGSDPGKTSPSQHECTHCAACFLTSALLVPAFETIHPDPAAQRIVPLAEASFTGFIPDGPERPPRPLIA